MGGGGWVSQLVVKPNAPPLTENSSEEERACDKWFRRRIASTAIACRAAAEDRDVCPSSQVSKSSSTCPPQNCSRPILPTPTVPPNGEIGKRWDHQQQDRRQNEGFGICTKISLVLYWLLSNCCCRTRGTRAKRAKRARRGKIQPPPPKKTTDFSRTTQPILQYHYTQRVANAAVPGLPPQTRLVWRSTASHTNGKRACVYTHEVRILCTPPTTARNAHPCGWTLVALTLTGFSKRYASNLMKSITSRFVSALTLISE